MADLELRFHRSMLTLSSPLDFVLERQGVDMSEDAEFMSLVEGDTVHDALSMQKLAGAACLVTATEGICRSRLAHKRMEDAAPDLAAAALATAQECSPQHIVCEIGPCGLPLDPSNAKSRAQSIKQYVQAAQALCKAEEVLDDGPFDAFLLNGMRSVADMQCAIAGVRSVSDKPLLASVNVNDLGEFEGMRVQGWISCMESADVVGICSDAAPDDLCRIVRELAQATDKPILVQIAIKQPTDRELRDASLGRVPESNPYPTPDHVVDCAVRLRAAGAQFLRAVGQVTPVYTGALAVVCDGADAIR